MSLRVWLPMNRDLRNQGLDDVTVTNNGATFNSAGKLGGCYSFNASGYLKETSFDWSNFNTSEFSLCCWYKEPSPVASGNSQMICIGTSSGWNNIRIGLLRRTSNGYPMFSVSDGTNNVNYNFTADSFALDTWNHIVCTYNNGTMKMYLNGVLHKTSTTTITPVLNSSQHLGVGAASNGSEPLTGSLNDVRIYDHCLSPMEVKELSKGLVLHYPLNRQGWGQENILLNTGFESRYTRSTGWDTTKNGTQLASYWGGYNGGVTNPSTVYHAHLKQVNGEWVYEYIRTANESWLGISQGGLQSKLTAGKTYTFSWEEYRVEGNNYPTGGLYYYKTGATSANFHLGQFGGSSGNILGKWRKFSYTFTAPTDGDYSKNMFWYIYGNSGGNGKMYMRHPKLEEGSIATPWCPNSSDALATAMGLNSLIEYDCSGFCNNSIYNSKPTVSSDTSKYNVSTYFGEYNTPKTDLIDNSLLPALTNCTITWWEKNDTTRTLLLTGQSTSHYIAASDNNTYYHGTVGGTKTLYRDGVAGTYKCEAGVWHHYALVGVDISTWTALHLNSYGSYWYLKGLVSDLRIYATALSADDVKSLYQNCATIDADGTIRGQIRS